MSLTRSALALLSLSIACTGGDKANDGDPGSDTGALSSIDADGDGFPADEDCDDDDASVNQGATEVCDGIDNDCDGEIDEGVTGVWYTDDDGDGYGDPTSPEEGCTQPPGTAANGSDCDDTDAGVQPAAIEVCDGVDNNCDGTIDEGVTGTWWVDADGDGFGDAGETVEDCAQPSGTAENADDCDDSDGDVNPDAVELCDGIDNDCDGSIDEDGVSTWYADDDGDGWGDATDTVEACYEPTGYVGRDGDCDDSDFFVSPDGTEVCNSIDDDCDGAIDEPDAIDAGTWYDDTDSDGFGDASASQTACTQPSGTVADDTDCDDGDFDVNPDGTEVCNSIDDDCDGTVDEPDAIDASTWYIDADSDTYGSSSSTVVDCNQPSGYVDNDDDCDDADHTIYPNSIEDWYDGVDADCDGFDDPDPCSTSLPGETTVADDPTCGVTGASSSSWSVSVEWQSADFSYGSGSGYTRVMMTPAIGNLTDDNGDGVVDDEDIPDIAYNTFQTNRYRYEGYLRVISGDGAGEHWSVNSFTYGGSTHYVHSTAGVAVGDFDDDGSPDIVTMTTGGYVVAFENDGTVKWVSADAAGSAYVHPGIANLDGTGDAEITAGGLVVDSAGNTLTSVSSQGLWCSFGADYDLDGDADLITGDAAWDSAGSATLSSGTSSGRSAVANLDADAYGEIINRYNTSLWAIDDDGSVLWTATADVGYGAPCVGDFDGDGDADIGIAGRYYFQAFDGSGTLLWQNSVFDTSSRSAGCSVFDFEGDGDHEIIYADQTDLYIWEGSTGAELYHNANHGSGTLWEYPLVADVDGDGNVEIIVASNDYAYSGWDGITVLGEDNDAWASARPTWNQFAYSVDHINDDMSVPTTPYDWWNDHNTFRGQTSWSDAADGAPDLGVYVLGACEDCSAGSLELYAAVDNSGAVFAPSGVSVAVYAVNGSTETFVDSQTTPDRINPGIRAAPLTFTIATSDVGADGLRVVVDDDGTGTGDHTECDETNNDDVWDALTCP